MVQRRPSRLSSRPNVDYSLPKAYSFFDEEEEEEEWEVYKTTVKSIAQAPGPSTSRRMPYFDLGFKQRMERLAWAFNALTNESLIADIYGLRLHHKAQLDKWKTWSQDKQEEVLKLFRTGRKTTVIANELDNLTDAEMYVI
ncbi:hypothetical protein V8C35DRAFT_282576 [Trichoderma chlorosporum]